MNPLRLGIFTGLQQLRDRREERNARKDDRAARAEDRKRQQEQQALTLDVMLRDKGYIPEGEAGPDASVSGRQLDDIVSAASGVPTVGMRGTGTRYESGPKGYRYDRMSPAAQEQTLERRLREAQVRALETPKPRDVRRQVVDGQIVDLDAGTAAPIRGYSKPREEGKPADANPVRGQFNSDQVFKDSQGMASSLAKIKAAQPSPAGDMSLVFNFMKMMDPGSSVREGEYANAQNAGGVSDKVRNLYNRALSGEMLQPSQRQDFIGQATGIAAAQRRLLRGTISRYTDIATRSGLNPQDVVVDPFGDLLDEPAPAPSGTAPPPTNPAHWLQQRRGRRP